MEKGGGGGGEEVTGVCSLVKSKGCRHEFQNYANRFFFFFGSIYAPLNRMCLQKTIPRVQRDKKGVHQEIN